MASIDHTMTVLASAAEVFQYLTDPDKATRWQSSLLEAHLSPEGPMQLGTQITEVRKLLGRTLESAVEVTEFQPPRRFAGRVVSGPVRGEFRYTLGDQDGSTSLEFHLEGEPGGFFRLGEPLVFRAMRKQLEADFAALREIVEGS